MIKIENLTVSYKINQPFSFQTKRLIAVDDVNLEIDSGKIYGLVGESGCGKSTLGHTIVRLIREDFGKIYLNDIELTSLSEKEFRKIRSRIQLIFQDPYSTLNPRLKINEIISEGLEIHTSFTKKEIQQKVIDILEKVNLNTEYLDRYPHEFSGGQKQRIAIARSLILNPEILICDESISALDVSTQIQVIELLRDLKNQFNLTYLFISHDLNMVNYFCDNIIVMYLGKIVESGSKEEVIQNTKHPYTKVLFDSIFDIHKRNKMIVPLEGEVPSLLNKPRGCYFHTRCKNKISRCEKEVPVVQQINNNHKFSCFNPL